MSSQIVNPDRLAVVARLEAVIDAEVETFVFTLVGERDGEQRRAALNAILESVYPSVPSELRGHAAAIRQAARERPRARVRVRCWAREGGVGHGEMWRIGGPADEPQIDGERLYARIRQMLAARLETELAETR